MQVGTIVCDAVTYLLLFITYRQQKNSEGLECLIGCNKKGNPSFTTSLCLHSSVYE